LPVVGLQDGGIDGLELAERLRGLDVSTPIVMITGYPDETSRESQFGRGASGAPEAQSRGQSGRMRSKRHQSGRATASLNNQADRTSVKPRKEIP
jgi:CheY-like chemotaxis protein